MIIADICHDRHDRQWYSFFCCEISSYFGPKFGYLRRYELFGVILLFTGLNSVVMYQKWQISCMWIYLWLHRGYTSTDIHTPLLVLVVRTDWLANWYHWDLIHLVHKQKLLISMKSSCCCRQLANDLLTALWEHGGSLMTFYKQPGHNILTMVRLYDIEV